jgi:hypothetical protein
MAKKKSAKAAKGEKPQSWVVTTSSDRPVADIAKDLSAAGFKVEQALDQIGVITGKSGDAAVRKARSIRGVTDISPDAPASVGPPKSKDTW